MKTMIAIPCMDTLPVGFVQSLLYLEKQNVSVCFKPNSLIYDARNLLALTAIQEKFDRVLWLDSDMMFDKDILNRMHADIDSQPTPDDVMITGVYVKRHTPHDPVLYDSIEPPAKDKEGRLVSRIHTCNGFPNNALFPVAGCGFGCVLTPVPLLKKVFDKFVLGFLPYPWAGEDISFCYRVNQIGGKILCDSSILCGHIGQEVYMHGGDRNA